MKKIKKIILAGGCFWGVEAYFQQLKGVVNTKVGYTDGYNENPTYEEVCSGSGHAEVCYIEFDELVISLEKVLEHFFRIIDPTLKNQQGNDIGIQYRNGIYYFDDEDKLNIENYLNKIKINYNKPLKTFVKKEVRFCDAEEYHQKYLIKNPKGYCHIDLKKIKDYEKK